MMKEEKAIQVVPVWGDYKKREEVLEAWCNDTYQRWRRLDMKHASFDWAEFSSNEFNVNELIEILYNNKKESVYVRNKRPASN